MTVNSSDQITSIQKGITVLGDSEIISITVTVKSSNDKVLIGDFLDDYKIEVVRTYIQTLIRVEEEESQNPTLEEIILAFEPFDRCNT